MSPLLFKTPDGISPQGLPNVYFCSHPADKDFYFDKIFKQIQNIRSCTMWYLDRTAPVTNVNDHLSDLEQMTLFVIPVTSRFLSTDNIALNTEFKFAMENNIPVLPLMQES